MPPWWLVFIIEPLDQLVINCRNKAICLEIVCFLLSFLLYSFRFLASLYCLLFCLVAVEVLQPSSSHLGTQLYHYLVLAVICQYFLVGLYNANNYLSVYLHRFKEFLYVAFPFRKLVGWWDLFCFLFFLCLWIVLAEKTRSLVSLLLFNLFHLLLLMLSF